MFPYLRRSWAEVSLDRIEQNYQAIRKHLHPDTLFMAVLKADAYGHGDTAVAKELEALGADWFAVSNLVEALSLRAGGIASPILIFGYTPPEHAALLNEYALTQTVYSLEYAHLLHCGARDAGVVLDVHIKVDTGMSRLGFLAGGGFLPQAIGEIGQVCALPQFRAEGIFTHFACADEVTADAVAFTRSQYDLFCRITSALQQQGHAFAIRHCCNSAGTLQYPQMHMDLVRPGIALFGLYPGSCRHTVALQPAMALRSCICMLKEIPAGTSVSYGREFTAKHTMRIATIPIGYADGFDRRLSGKARVLIGGQFADVIGRVCMDRIMADVSHIPGLQIGDAVTILGEDGTNRISCEELGEMSDTTNYERVCLIGKRIPRVYLRQGEEVLAVDRMLPQKSIPVLG